VVIVVRGRIRQGRWRYYCEWQRRPLAVRPVTTDKRRLLGSNGSIIMPSERSWCHVKWRRRPASDASDGSAIL